MNLKSLMAGSALLLASAASQAGVVYEWVTVNNPMPVNAVSMRIEVEESVVRRGSFGVSADAGMQTIPRTGLVSFSFFGSTISLEQWFPTAHGYLEMDLRFVHNNFYLVGSIRAHDFNARISTSSGAGAGTDPWLWTIHDLNGDSVLGCSFDPKGRCEGATGYFRQVPEPASIALLGLGAFGLAASRRHKRQA